MSVAEVHADGIHAVQLPQFSLKDLFRVEELKECEIDEAPTLNEGGSTYGGDNSTKRPSCPEDKGDVSDRPSKKARNTFSPPVLPGKGGFKRRKKEKREEADWKKYGHLSRPSTKRKYINTSQVHKTSCIVSNLPIKKGGYTSKPSNFKDTPEVQTLDDALALGLVLVKYSSLHQPIIDYQGRIVAVLAPPPHDLSYFESVKRAGDRMKKEESLGNFDSADFAHGRGEKFAALSAGLSYGNGHTKPSWPLGRHPDIIDALLGDVDIQRLASHQDATYALWHPKAYQYYKENLDRLWEEYPHLPHPLFPRSIMPSVTFNLGKCVATKKHVDSQNCPFGWCIVTALGNFDATKGGHIILWDLGIILEFPAGACVCLPSAIITHSNIPTGKGETRMSFTQYCSGEIFRHIENGFRTDKALVHDDPLIFLFRQRERETRIEKGYAMFSKMEDLVENVK